MKMFEDWKQSRKVKRDVIKKIDECIDSAEGERVAELMKKRREVSFNGVDAGDVLKVVANVLVVGVLVGFEMSHIMNQKGSRFIKSL